MSASSQDTQQSNQMPVQGSTQTSAQTSAQNNLQPTEQASLRSTFQSTLQSSLALFVLLTVATGLVYPAVVTGLATAFFKEQAEGSLIYRSHSNRVGQVARVAIGSKLIGQNFSSPAYFWPRPSATSPAYNAAASSGSNLGPTNEDLLASVKSRVEAVRANNLEFDKTKKIPVDLVTASGSGLDPDISPAAARVQIERVAKARGLNPQTVQDLVNNHSEPKQPGFLDEPHVNVLLLNLALDKLTSNNQAEDAARK